MSYTIKSKQLNQKNIYIYPEEEEIVENSSNDIRFRRMLYDMGTGK